MSKTECMKSPRSRWRSLAGLTTMTACAGLSGTACSPVQTTPTTASSTPAIRANSPPTISGQPSNQITAGVSYTFSPLARDSDLDPLTFAIDNKPAWADFNRSTGTLSGVPTLSSVGSYPGIVIRVTDGNGSASLTPFTLTVVAPTATTGTANLSWTVPTQYTDGGALTDLAGYWVYHGTLPNGLQRFQQVADAATTQYAVTGLSSGTHYFAVAAYNASGVESSLSNVGTKSIP
jgi:Putative Ig domain